MDDKEQERLSLAVEIVNFHREDRDPYEIDFHGGECEGFPSNGERLSIEQIYKRDCSACLSEWNLEDRFIDKLGGIELLPIARKYLDLHEQVTELYYPITSLSDDDQARVRIVHKEKKRRREQIEYQLRHPRTPMLRKEVA